MCPAQDEDFAAIHPFSGSPKKNWPLERYRELGRLLSRRLPVKWIVEPWIAGHGGSSTRSRRSTICTSWPAGWPGRGSTSATIPGITHLAAAAGTRVLALFGPTDPAVWAPRGPNVRVLAAPRPGESMESSPLRKWLAAVLGMLPG